MIQSRCERPLAPVAPAGHEYATNGDALQKNVFKSNSQGETTAAYHIPHERSLSDIQPLFLCINLQNEMFCIVHTEIEAFTDSQRKELLEVL